MAKEKVKKPRRRGIAIPGRIVTAGILIILQITLFILLEMSVSKWVTAAEIVLRILSLFIVFAILNKRDNPSYKLMWVIFIIVTPLVGGVLFFLWGNGKVKPALRKHMQKQKRLNKHYLWQDPAVATDLHFKNIDHARQSQFLFNESGHPVHTDTTVEFIAPGEAFLPRMLEELKNAEKYIFIEYFILAEGKMWSAIYDVLREKVKQGVEVRIIFDDFGSISRQHRHFVKRLRNDGIKVMAFNKIRASIDLFLRNRRLRFYDGWLESCR